MASVRNIFGTGGDDKMNKGRIRMIMGRMGLNCREWRMMRWMRWDNRAETSSRDDSEEDIFL